VRPYPPGPPQKKSPLRGLVLGLVLVVGIAFFAISLMQYLNADPGVAGPDVNQTTAPVPQNTTPVPAPDTNPPELPQPTTYEEAETWLVSNPVYEQIAPVPTDCAVPRIDITTASAADLTTHLNELTACLWRVWSGPLESAGFQLPRPPVTVYTEPITTGCGNLDEVNAVYCAADQRIYYAKPLWKIFPPEQQKAPFVVESILAHEFGHTIQARTGILISGKALEQRMSDADAIVASRRMETQADCFAAKYVRSVAQSQSLDQAKLAAIDTLVYNLGDDVLSGKPNINGGHGLGKTRQAWFSTGMGSDTLQGCNTFNVPANQVR